MKLSRRDKKWKTLNRRLIDFGSRGDDFGMAVTYYEMAAFLDGEGRNSDDLREKGYRIKLKYIQRGLKAYQNRDFLKEVAVLGDPSSCEYCKRQEGKIFKLEDALKENPIPVKNCTFKYGCRCTYIPMVER